MLPRDVYDKIGVREIKISLCTSNVREARFLAAFMDVHVTQFLLFWRGIRSVQKEQLEQIRQIVVRWIQKKKEELEDLRAMGMSDFIVQIDGETGERIQTTSEDRIKALQEAVEVEQEKLKGNVLSETWIEIIASQLAKENGIPLPKKEGPHEEEALPYRRLCFELRKAFVNLGEEEINMMNGIYDDYTEIAKQKGLVSMVSPSSASLTKQESQNNRTQRLSDLLKSYVEHEKSKDIVEKSVSEIRSKCKLFIEIIGDPFVEDLKDEMIYKYLEDIKKLPSRHTISKKYRSKSIECLLKMKIPQKDLLGDETIRNHIGRVKSFFLWLEKRGYLPNGKYSCLFEQNKRSKLPHEARDVFSTDDLNKMFSHKDYLNFKKPWEFWLPLIALYTGMRINEICQLLLDDIVKEVFILYFRICEGEGKTLKTKTSQRNIPIHPELIDLGFIDYVKMLKRDRCKYLFPDLNGNKTKPSHTPIKKINQWIKRIGIMGNDKTGKKVFHSFRHTFANRCKELGLDQEMTAEILGHSEGRGDMRLIYTKPTGIKKLYSELISKIYYDLNLTKLKNYMKEKGPNPWEK
jgi:integrase